MLLFLHNFSLLPPLAKKWLKELLEEVINAINENRERVDYIIKRGLEFYDINDNIIKNH